MHAPFFQYMNGLNGEVGSVPEPCCLYRSAVVSLFGESTLGERGELDAALRLRAWWSGSRIDCIVLMARQRACRDGF